MMRLGALSLLGQLQFFLAFSPLPSIIIPRAFFSAIPLRPRDIDLPLDKIDFSYARSSGPGGQNVNKVNSKAEMRFHVMDADWLPIEVRQRLFENQSNRINKVGELVVTSQENRTQTQNRADCIEKLQLMIAEAYIEPTVRVVQEGLSEKGKEVRRQEKKKRGEVKSSRSQSRSFDYDD